MQISVYVNNKFEIFADLSKLIASRLCAIANLTPFSRRLIGFVLLLFYGSHDPLKSL